MRIVISNSSDEPIYMQVKEQIKRAILSGELESATLLPSIRGLAQDLQISVITTKRAYDELEKEGLVEAVTGKGTFVAGHNRALLREISLRQLQEKLEDVIDTSKSLGMTFDEFVEMVTILYEEGS